MEIKWLNKLVMKLAEEAYKSKIEALDKRMIDLEKKHEIIMKSIADSEKKLGKLDDRLYDANIDAAKTVGALQAFIKSKNHNLGE
mgnify:CR=1 FL=1